MPTEPVRERVQAALEARLKTIAAGVVIDPQSGQSVEYFTTPSLVTRALLWITQYDQLLEATSPTTRLDIGPVLGVVRSSGSTFERVLHGDPDRPLIEAFEHEQRVTIWGYVKGSTAVGGVLASTRIERLWQDHVACLLTDTKLGGLALDC
jgi:hypothetical protein